MADPLRTSVQQPAAESGDVELDTVIVEAQRQQDVLERQVNTFVSSITIHSWTDSLIPAPNQGFPNIHPDVQTAS